MRKRLTLAAVLAVLALGVSLLAALPADASSIENRDATVHSVDINRATKNNARPTSSPLLTYHGGTISPGGKVFVVYWGQDWGTEVTGVDIHGVSGGTYTGYTNDSKHLAEYQQAFLSGLFGSLDTWSTSTTQYCQSNASVAVSGSTCPALATFVGHPDASPLGGVWQDTDALAPSQPTQSQLAAEAVKAANHFAAAASGFNQATDQVVVDTFHAKNSSGFGTQYCAWHSSTAYGTGRLAYTNMPYLPDAGASCGANYVPVTDGSGPLEGISIVGGHEYAETITDMAPNGGWLDSKGGENGDKCAWKSPGSAGGSATISLATGTFAVQTLWSNSFGTGGGCPLSYVKNPDGTVTQFDGKTTSTK
jgi:serine protease